MAEMSSELSPLVFAVLPPEGQFEAQQADKLEELRQASAAREWELVTVKSRSVDSRLYGESRRPLRMLEPWDARELYNAAHRRPVGVTEFRSVRVQRNPGIHASSENSVSLARFIKYKAFYRQVPNNRNPDGTPSTATQFVEGFENWMRESGCLGDRDPRCIPLISFSAREDWTLDTPDGVRRFEAIHGRPTDLRDDARREWRRPFSGGMHGQTVLTVAQRELPRGFHWDVWNSGQSTSLYAINEIWTFPRSSYANVHPDASIRRGQSSAISARVTFTAEKPSSLLNEAATPPPPKPQVKQGRKRSRGGGR
jgi:hypothetical protein